MRGARVEAVAVQPNWGLSIYAASKAAVERLVRAAANELGGTGIRVNAVRPSLTASQGTAKMQGMAGIGDYFAAETVLGRIGASLSHFVGRRVSRAATGRLSPGRSGTLREGGKTRALLHPPV